MSLIRTTSRGYRFNRLFFIIPLFIMVAMAGYIAYTEKLSFSSQQFYFKCNKDFCPNPFNEMQNCKTQIKLFWLIPIYESKDCIKECSESWCKQKIIPKGEYGQKPSWLATNFLLLAIGMIAFSLIFNHVIYNWGIEPHLGVVEYWRDETNKIKDFLRTKWHIKLEWGEDESDKNNRIK